MAVEKINIEHFLELMKFHPVLDVRSPGEYLHARIPGSYSLPLFSDEERKVVGTTYKQQSRESAIKIGLDFFGPKMRKMVDEVEGLFSKVDERSGNPGSAATALQGKTVIVHCWRGGMRSAGVAWLLDLYGFRVYTLVGGYKRFRRWAIDQLEKPRPLHILGGYTGSGKTEMLKQLARSGEAVIDLEELANHKGSAFGNIGLPSQPSQEMFENLLALAIYRLTNDSDEMKHGERPGERVPLWLEDESQRIGTVNIPQAFWLNMRQSPVFFLDIPFSERLKHIVEEYGALDKDRMIAAIARIQKRLGGLETKLCVQLLEEGKVEEAFGILLKYYDKWYLKGLHNRVNAAELCSTIPLKGIHFSENAKELVDAAKDRAKQKLVDEHRY